MNLIKVEAIKPRNDPNAALRALLNSALFKSSPINAPKNGPIIMPPGIGAIKPTIKPIDVPIIPAFVPPKRLVPMAGMM